MNSASHKTVDSVIENVEDFSNTPTRVESFFSTNATLLRKLENLSASILLEDEDINAEINTLMTQLAKSEKSIFALSNEPYATLPLSIAARSDNSILSNRALKCLQQIVARY